MNLTFQQNALIVTLRSTQHDHQTQFSPHLSFALLNWQQLEAKESLPLPLAKFHQSLVATEQLIYRLIARVERIETVTSITIKAKPDSISTPSRQISPPDNLLQAQPVSKVFRHTPSVVMEPSLSEQHHQRPTIGRHSSNHPKLAADPTSLIDVNRLTDQVVQAIDRRMIAYRERLGRI